MSAEWVDYGYNVQKVAPCVSWSLSYIHRCDSPYGCSIFSIAQHEGSKPRNPGVRPRSRRVARRCSHPSNNAAAGFQSVLLLLACGNHPALTLLVSNFTGFPVGCSSAHSKIAEHDIPTAPRGSFFSCVRFS